MSQPTRYNRVFNFTAFSTASPSAQQPGVSIDAEYNAIKKTMDQTLSNLALIQRDDTRLANAVVTPESLSAATLALIGGGWTPRGAWVTATAYSVKDVVSNAGVSYVCATAHTSGVSFNAANWVAIGTNTLWAPSVKDFGAIGDGVINDTPAFTSAGSAAGPGGVAVIPDGNYKLTTPPSNYMNVGWVMYGASFSPNFPPWQTNGGVYGNAWLVIEGQSDVPRHSVYVSQKINPTSSAASYESSAFYARVFSTDPSTGLISRDAVAVIGQALIGYGCNPGSATAANFVAQAVDATADGRLGGIEIDIIPSIDQPTLDTTTQKQGLLIVGYNKLSTAAMRVSGVTGGNFQYGLRFDSSGIKTGGFVINYQGLFSVLSDGSVIIGADTLASGGSGVLGIKNAAVVPNSNPSSGGVLYVQAGALKYRGSGGTVTTIANA